MWEEKINIYFSIRVLHSIDWNILKVKAVTEYIVPTFLNPNDIIEFFDALRSCIIYTLIDLILFYWFMLLIDTLFYLDLSRYHFPEIIQTYYFHIIYTLFSIFIWSIIIIFRNMYINLDWYYFFRSVEIFVFNRIRYVFVYIFFNQCCESAGLFSNVFIIVRWLFVHTIKKI